MMRSVKEPFRIPSDFGSLRVKVLEGIDLFFPTENGIYDRKNMQSICLDISIYYGASVHSSFSTTAVPFSDGQVEFDDETYLFQSVKPEHFLQVTLIALRNYTTGYGISPQSLGVLKIPVERLHESTISQWYPFCAANGITTLRSAIKLEITYSRIYLIFRNYDDCRESSVGSGAFDDIHCRAPTTQVSLEADAASSADKGFRRRSFTNFGRSQSQLGYARVPSNLDVFGKDGPGGDRYDRMPVGLADYFVIVGPTAASVGVDDLSQEGCVLSNNGDVSIWDRFPRNDYPDGPMPPKVEWFCFPDGAVYQWSTNRPSPQLSSYVMLAGDSRQYGVTLTYFVRAEMTHGAPPPAYPSEQATATPATNETWWEGEIDPMHPSQRHCFDGAHVCWMSVCICFLTRAPFVQQLSICLMKIYIADILPKLSEWEKGFLMDKKAQLKLFKYSAFFIESSFLLVSLCLDCPLPVPEVFYVNLRLPDKYNSPKIDEMLDSYFPGVFAGQTVEPVLVPATSTDALYSSLPPISDSGDLIFSLPSHRTLYKCQYSLEEFFLLFGVRGGVDLVHCAILEQKILFHSKDFSLLPMACECIRALLYPLSCSCVYIPVVPSTLLDLVEAPVPYILGIHSDWIQFFKPDLLADVLICDCNTGSICVGMAGPELRTLKIPKLPEKLDRWLVMGLKYALGYLNSKTLFSLDSDAEACQPGSLFDSDIQSIIQLLFIDALSSFFVGLPECLIFIDSEYPLFNKPLFLSEFTEDDDCEFVSSLTETQGFDRLISTIQTPNLTFFCMGMERRMKFCDVFRCSDCCSEEESHVTALNIRGRQYPKWVYHRVPCSILLGISERCAGEFGNIKLLVDSRLFIYGFDGNGKIKDSEVKLIQNCNSRDSDSNVDVIKRGLNVIVPNDGELDSKRSRFRTSNAKLSKKINRKSKFFDDFFGGNDGLAAVATNYDIAKTIEKNLSIKKTRRAGITFQASFDGNDVLGSGSFGHSGSFAENEKLWAMEGNGTATASLARELSPSSFRESFVGSDLVVDPPVRFSKATFQVALKNAGNWSALDVASSLNLPQEDVINAVEQKAAGKENITLRGCFVEGGARQRDAMELLTVTDVSTSMSFTQEGRSILDLLKAIHSGKVLSSFSHSKTMKLLQDSIYSLNFSTNRKRFLQILSRSERGAYGHSEGDNDLGDKTKFIQLDFEAYEVLGTLCSKFLSSCMVNKDYSSAFALLESIQYYFRIAAVVGRRKQAKLGQTYTSFTHRSIFQSNALAALQCNDFSSDESVSSIDVIDNYPENGSGDDIGNDDVTAQKFTALRLAAYELADSNRAILKDVVGLNNDFSDLSAKKSVSFVPLAPVKSVSASQRESVICLLSGHPLFQVLEFWQDIIATRLIKSNYVIPILGTQGDTQASVASDEASDASKQFALDFCVDLLNDLHSFGLPGDLGAVVVQGVALKWRLSIAEYRSLFNSICKIWNLEAQLCNIDRAYDKWKSLDLESKDKDNNESVIIVGKQSLVSDIIENLSILRAAAIDTTMPLANIGDLFINRTVIRRHTIHDIKYHSRFSTNFDAALSLDKSKIDIRDIYQLVDLSHPVSLPKNMRRYSLAGEVAKLREIEAEKFMEANFNQNKVQTKEELLSAGLANKSSDDLKNVLSFEKEISVFRSSSFESGSDQDVESGFNFGQSSSWLGKFNDVIDHEKNHIFDEVGRNEKDLQRSFSLHKSLDFFPAPEEIVTDPAQQNECCMMKDLQILTDFGAQDLTTEPAGVLIQQSPLFLSGQNATIRTLSLQCLTPEKNSTLDEEPLILHKRVASIPARISGSLLNLAFHNLPIESADLHSSEVTSLSACDRWLVSGDSSGVVRVVDMKSGRLIESREHSESILSVVCLPVHEGYLTCCRGGVINLWSYPRDNNRSVAQDAPPLAANGGRMSIPNDFISDMHEEPSPSRWGMISGLKKSKVATLKLGSIKVTGFVTNVGLKPNIGVLSRPLMFAVGGSKGELRVFNKNGAGFVELFSHNQYDPNGKSAKCVCALYLTTEHKRSNAPTGADFDRREGINAVTVATRSGMLARMRSARSSSNISHANSENDNGFLAVGSRSGLVECWDVAKQECIFSTGLGHAEGHTGRVNSLIIIMDGSGRYPNLLFSGGNDGAARLYDLRSKRCCLVINNDGGPVTCVLGACFGAGSRILYVASSDGVVRCFSFKNGEIVRLIRTFRGHFDRIMSMEFLTDNNEDIIKTCSRDGTVRIWNTGIFRKSDDIDIEQIQISAINAPLEATIILRPPKIPFIAINASASSFCTFVTKPKTEALQHLKDSKGIENYAGSVSCRNDSCQNHYFAAGMTDGSLCVWAANQSN